ncbi:hypothetical protein [Cysteiniphilum marinum]|uniref:hypothetical protein n=1 Tax=Cysteiniphilum marinum TaxID=2774191 RepID=UPI00193B7970|nr:hypothetical protein [Cysteiniphilum marinum]
MIVKIKKTLTKTLHNSLLALSLCGFGNVAMANTPSDIHSDIEAVNKLLSSDLSDKEMRLMAGISSNSFKVAMLKLLKENHRLNKEIHHLLTHGNICGVVSDDVTETKECKQEKKQC